MTNIEERIAKYFIVERNSAVTVIDIIEDTELEDKDIVYKKLEEMYNKELLTSDFYNSDDGRQFARYYSTTKLENKYHYV